MSTSHLRIFLGLTGYYHRFIKCYARIALPLMELLCKDAFTWSPVTQDTFERLVKELTSTPTLVLQTLTFPSQYRRTL